MAASNARTEELPPLPESTYRLQFHAGFTFRDATAIVEYLDRLGVSHAYASPYFKARAGSTHGYDVVDPNAINPEVGSEAEHEAWVGALRARGMGHIPDIVPNHMGVATNENAWWNEVLEHGPSSAYAEYFDIDWRGSPRPELADKVLLPILGELYADVLERGQLRLAHEAGAFALYYHERRLPLNPSSYGLILDPAAGGLTPDDPGRAECLSILTAIRHLPAAEARDPARAEERRRETRIIQRRLGALVERHESVRRQIERAIERFDAGRMDELLGRQCYRLAWWRTATDEINYRRFFDVNELAALRMEGEEVFLATHARVLQLLGEGKVDGLRIDHPDGLLDPAQYFARLQQAYAQARWPGAPPPLRRPWPLYVVAEKILAMDEPLPGDWAVYGTSGYDFLNRVNGLFVDSAAEDAFTELYAEFTGESADFRDVAYEKKRLILRTSLASELQMLAHRVDRLGQRHRRWRDFTLNAIRHALAEVIACFPVYRCYACGEEPGSQDRRQVDAAIAEAARRNPGIAPPLLEFIRDVLLLQYPADATDEMREDQRRIAGRFQQLTAPATAKGVEDTAFYVYNRFVSLNEVGGEPGHFGISPQRLHDWLRERQDRWPYSLSALSTHDTKRSEDVRARLNVLSEMPEGWRQRVLRWRGLNEAHRQRVGGIVAPSRNEEYLLYQILLGAWPLEIVEDRGALVGRIQAYMQKAMREAKVHTRWTDPDVEYESAVERFIAAILDPDAEFLADFLPFQRKIGRLGLVNSLAQTLIRLTAPGVPDTYQGTELWDFSLVDPDNRRPVDYAHRMRLLEELESGAWDARQLAQDMEDGRAKLLVTQKALQCRRMHRRLFTEGEYLPIEADGPGRDRLFAFARRRGNQWAVTVVPRLVASGIIWQDTHLRLPGELASRPLRNLFTGEPPSASVAEVFATFPVALFATPA